jgi:nitroreductase
MATAFMILRATELGLVAHPVAGYDEEKVKDILAIPKDMRLITLVNVGKHSTTVSAVLSEKQKLGEKQRPERLPFAKFAYTNKYQTGA